MPTYQTFSMFVRLFCAVVGTALTLLVLLQLHHDRKSRWFAILAGIIGGIAFNGLLLRIFWVLGGSIHELFNLAGVLTGAIPFVTYIFTNEYLETWTPRRRLWANLLAVCLGIVAIYGMRLQLHRNVQITPEGFITYEMYPATVILLGVGVLASLMTLRILWQQYRQHQSQSNLQILIGIGIMSSGVLLLSIPWLSKYTLEQVLYAAGALVIAGPVFQQRLFDPLTRLNAKLARQTEQFTALMRVGQQTTSLLALEPLLEAVAREIRHGFGYDAVVIYLADHTRQFLNFQPHLQGVVRMLVADTQSSAGTAAITRKPVFIDAVSHDNRERLLQGSSIQSEICIPLIVGKDNTLIGVLNIQSCAIHAFGQDDIEVLQILANQTATAIHNAQLFEQAQQARQAADAASRHKTGFLAMMNHELRTPLQTIITHSQWMLHHPELYDRFELPATYRTDLERVNHSAEHLHHLINNVLDLSKIEAGEIDLERSSANPVALLDEVMKASQSLLKPGVEWHSVYATTLPLIHADGLRVYQILSNIISNACKFCEEGAITINAVPNENMLHFSITDTGIGIPIEAQAELFNPFKQATRHIVRQYGGTGLGLSICQKLVLLHGGQIWFDSQPDRGTTFHFTIPLALADALPPDSNERQPRTFIFPKMKGQIPPPLQLLVIATEPEPPASLDAQLRAAGYHLLWTHQVEQGTKWAETLEPEVIATLGLPSKPQFSNKQTIDFEAGDSGITALLEYLNHTQLTNRGNIAAMLKEN